MCIDGQKKCNPFEYATWGNFQSIAPGERFVMARFALRGNLPPPIWRILCAVAGGMPNGLTFEIDIGIADNLPPGGPAIPVAVGAQFQTDIMAHSLTITATNPNPQAASGTGAIGLVGGLWVPCNCMSPEGAPWSPQ